MAWWDNIPGSGAGARQPQMQPYWQSQMGTNRRNPEEIRWGPGRQPSTPQSNGIDPHKVMRQSTGGAFLPQHTLPGPGGVAGLPGAPTPQSTDDEIVSFLMSNYPYMGAFLHNPEVRSVLIQGARAGWDENKLKGALTGTRWWQTTDAANRTWQQLQSEDPAEARRLVGQTAAAVQNSARSLGVNMDAGTIADIAATATANGWTDAQTIDHLVGAFNWNTTPGGDMTAYRDSVKQIGAQYLVKVSEQTARQYAQAIASGEMTQQGVQSIMQRQARARFSYIGDLIDQGVTPSDYFAGARDRIADELEVDSDQIDMMDPKWLSLLEVRDEKGQTRGATLNEAMLAARRQPEWAGTQKAQERTASMASMLGDIFGRKGI